MNSSNTVICSLYFKFNAIWKFLRSRLLYSLACDNGLLFTHNFLMISAAVFVSTPHILLKIQSTNFPFLKKCAHHYPQINISRVSHAFNILWWYQMYWFFFCLSLYSVSIYIRFYDDWHPFAEKKLSAMAAERIRTKKLLAEVTKDLTPEQINGKSVLVFKKNCWRQICYVFKMIAYKKRSALLFSWLCTDYTRKQFYFFSWTKELQR